MTAPVTSLVGDLRGTLIEDIARADSALADALRWPSTRRLDADAPTRVRLFVVGDRAEFRSLSEQVLGITGPLDRVDRLTRLVERSAAQTSTLAPREPM